MNNLKHITIRVLALIIGLFICIPLALSMLNPNRKCGTGDSLAILFWMLVVYALWSLFMIIELILLHKKGQSNKRNVNIIMVSFLPSLSCLIWLYLIVIDFL